MWLPRDQKFGKTSEFYHWHLPSITKICEIQKAAINDLVNLSAFPFSPDAKFTSTPLIFFWFLNFISLNTYFHLNSCSWYIPLHNIFQRNISRLVIDANTKANYQLLTPFMMLILLHEVNLFLMQWDWTDRQNGYCFTYVPIKWQSIRKISHWKCKCSHW